MHFDLEFHPGSGVSAWRGRVEEPEMEIRRWVIPHCPFFIYKSCDPVPTPGIPGTGPGAYFKGGTVTLSPFGDRELRSEGT